MTKNMFAMLMVGALLTACGASDKAEPTHAVAATGGSLKGDFGPAQGEPVRLPDPVDLVGQELPFDRSPGDVGVHPQLDGDRA